MLGNLIIAVTLMGQARTEPLPEKTTVEYLEEADVTVIRLNLKDFTNDAGTHLVSIDFAHKGRDPQAAKEVVLHIYRYGPRWEYLKSHDVRATCGDEKLKIRKVDYWSEESPRTPEGRCNEYLDIYVPAPDLQGMLEQARDLKVEIGGRQSCVLDEATRARIIKFVKAVRSGEY